MAPKRNPHLDISLDFFEAEMIVRLADSNDNPEILSQFCWTAIIGGKRSDWETDKAEVIRLARAMVKIAS